MKKSIATKLWIFLATLAVLAYFCVQAWQYFSDPLVTTLAYPYTVEESTELSGYVVRSERVLDADDAGGLVRIQRTEGEKVSAGGTIAVAYADQASLDRQDEIERLSTRIEQLQYAQDAALGAEASLKLDAQILQSLLRYRQAVTADRLDTAEREGSELRSLILKRDYTYSDTEDLTARITELKTQLQGLRTQSASTVRRISAPVSGTYSAVVDGYEAVLTPDKLGELTPSQLSALRADETVRSDLGKLILGDAWYYAAVMPAREAEELKEAGKLTLRFAKSIDQDLEMKLESVGPEENGRVVVTLSSRKFLSRLTLLRQQSAQIVRSAAEGVRVPAEALRMRAQTVTGEDGGEAEVQVTGVYCLVGREALFKPVTVTYSGDGFVLVEPAAPADREERWIRPGDEVIVKAIGLYDGKVIG